MPGLLQRLPTFGQSSTRANYEPLPGNEPDDELPLYDVREDGYKSTTGSNDSRAPSAPLHTLRNVVNAAIAAIPTRPTDIRKTLSTTAWYTLYGVRFVALSSLFAFTVGGIGTLLGLFLLRGLEPYKTVLDVTDGSDVWVEMIGAGVLGTCLGLALLLVFVVARSNARARRRMRLADPDGSADGLKWTLLLAAMALGAVAGLFAGAVGVALAPTLLPREYRPMHAISAAVCGIAVPLSPVLVFCLLFSCF